MQDCNDPLNDISDSDLDMLLEGLYIEEDIEDEIDGKNVIN